MGDLKYGNGKSKFVQKFVDNKQANRTMEDMEVSNITWKGSMLSIWEKFHIHIMEQKIITK